MILAAGEGRRMRPLTNHIPKPMVEIGGKAMIDHALDHLEQAGVQNVTVNLHYKAEILKKHLAQRESPPLTLLHEPELLNTGGGIKNALPSLGPDPFYVVSGDSLWSDDPGQTALERMAATWNPVKMDLLLLLQPVDTMTLTTGVGDYNINPDGSLTRTPDHSGAYMWTSIRLCKPKLFNNTPDDPFSFLNLMDRAESQGTLYGLVHNGNWHHISTPEDVQAVNVHLQETGKIS